EDFEIVVVDLIAQTCVANLIHACKLIEAYGIAVRHDEPVKRDGKARLAERFHALGLPQNLRARGDEKVLAVMGVNIVGDEALDRAIKVSAETIEERGF